MRKVYFFLALACLSGCVSSTYHKKVVGDLQTDLAAKNERLKKFNQLDANGNLRNGQ